MRVRWRRIKTKTKGKDKVNQVGCNKLVIESSYNRLIAPPPLNKGTKAIIRITITIHSILQVGQPDRRSHPDNPIHRLTRSENPSTSRSTRMPPGLTLVSFTRT